MPDVVRPVDMATLGGQSGAGDDSLQHAFLQRIPGVPTPPVTTVSVEEWEEDGRIEIYLYSQPSWHFVMETSSFCHISWKFPAEAL